MKCYNKQSYTIILLCLQTIYTSYFTSDLQVISIEVGIPHVVLFDTTGEADVEINKELGSSFDELKAQLPPVSQTFSVIANTQCCVWN